MNDWIDSSIGILFYLVPSRLIRKNEVRKPIDRDKIVFVKAVFWKIMLFVKDGWRIDSCDDKIEQLVLKYGHRMKSPISPKNRLIVYPL